MKYLKVWTSFKKSLEPLSDAEKGRLFMMMLQYAEDGTEPGEIAGNERYTWPGAQQMIDLMTAENARLTENGKKGGRPPKTNENQTKPSETKENQPEPTKTQKEKKIKEIERNEIKDNLFNRFWDAYPRKVAKPDARKKFEKIDPDEAMLQAMLKAIERSRNSEQWIKDGGQYIPHPSTWLNQRRWEDDPPAPAAKVTVSAQAYSQRDYTNEQEEAMMRMIQGAIA